MLLLDCLFGSHCLWILFVKSIKSFLDPLVVRFSDVSKLEKQVNMMKSIECRSPILSISVTVEWKWEANNRLLWLAWEGLRYSSQFGVDCTISIEWIYLFSFSFWPVLSTCKIIQWPVTMECLCGWYGFYHSRPSILPFRVSNGFIMKLKFRYFHLILWFLDLCVMIVPSLFRRMRFFRRG